MLEGIRRVSNQTASNHIRLLPKEETEATSMRWLSAVEARELDDEIGGRLRIVPSPALPPPLPPETETETETEEPLLAPR